MIASPLPRAKLLSVARELPAAPRILALLGRRLLDPNTELADVAELIRCDAALTARIIRIANSVVYHADESLASLEAALGRVGFVEVYRLTGMVALSQIAEQNLPLYGITSVQFRENSLLTALIIEELAVPAGIDTAAAYTAGLMRSVGKVALNRLVAGADCTGGYETEDVGPLVEWETDKLGLGNCEMAAQLLQEWRFPAATIAAIRDHYEPAPENAPAHLLNLAASAADRCGHGLPGESSYWTATPEKLAATGLTESDLDEATRRGLERFGPVRAALG